MFRDMGSLVKHGVGFKSVYKLKGEYVSPTNKDFVWGAEGIVTARCRRQKPYNWDKDFNRLVGAEGESWHPAEEIPHDDCTCGLYSAFAFGDATIYEDQADQAVLVMVETYGDTLYYDLGMRSAQLRVVAIAGSVKRFSDDVACEIFKVPFFSLDVAKAFLDIQNFRVSIFCKEKWNYKPFYLSKEEVEKKAEQLPPLEWIEIDDSEGILVEDWPFK